jgi:hypothetical protein
VSWSSRLVGLEALSSEAVTAMETTKEKGWEAEVHRVDAICGHFEAVADWQIQRGLLWAMHCLEAGRSKR